MPSEPFLLGIGGDLQFREKRNVCQYQSPPFSKKCMQWGKNGRYERICLFSLQKHTYRGGGVMGSQHPSPDVKTFCNFEPRIWLEIITSRDAQSACFKGSRTSCREIIFGIFWPKFGQKNSHHVMDASCRGCRIRPKQFNKCLPAGTGAKIDLLMS